MTPSAARKLSEPSGSPYPVLHPRPLGNSDLRVSPIGLGCWQFSGGVGLVGRYWPTLDDDTVAQVVRAAWQGGIDWFDTAEAYGRGRSEASLAAALQELGIPPGGPTIATKWWPVLRTAGTIASTLKARQKHLAPYPIDLHQVHQPFGLSSVSSEMRVLAGLVEEGHIRAVGVSNFSAPQMRRAHAALAEYGIPLASNQVRYSLLNRRVETNGVLDAARELGVSLIAWSPLEQGLLTGKFHDDPSRIRSRPGPRRFSPAFRKRRLEETVQLVGALREIADNHRATVAQVALNWLVTGHGDTVLAIPGATRPRHADESAGVLQFRLAQEEWDRLDRLSRRYR